MRLSADNGFVAGSRRNFFHIFIFLRHITDMMGVKCQRVINQTAFGKILVGICRIFCYGAIKPFTYHCMPAVHNFLLGKFTQGKHHYAAGVTVQAMDSKGTVLCVKGTVFAHKVFKNLLGCLCVTAIKGNAEQATWLVYDDQIVILIQNFEFEHEFSL